MAYNEALTNRVREALLEGLSRTAKPKRKIVEKKMFRGVTFMVDGKMCVSAGDDTLMFRIDPMIHDDMVANTDGAKTVIMKGREYKGYVHVHEDAVKSKRQLNRWIDLALEFNTIAKASPKKKKRAA
jgi:TfoX/Sxy family transcriptional regulator of competence genes